MKQLPFKVQVSIIIQVVSFNSWYKIDNEIKYLTPEILKEIIVTIRIQEHISMVYGHIANTGKVVVLGSFPDSANLVESISGYHLIISLESYSFEEHVIGSILENAKTIDMTLLDKYFERDYIEFFSRYAHKITKFASNMYSLQNYLLCSKIKEVEILGNFEIDELYQFKEQNNMALNFKKLDIICKDKSEYDVMENIIENIHDKISLVKQTRAFWSNDPSEKVNVYSKYVVALDIEFNGKLAPIDFDLFKMTKLEELTVNLRYIDQLQFQIIKEKILKPLKKMKYLKHVHFELEAGDTYNWHIIDYIPLSVRRFRYMQPMFPDEVENIIVPPNLHSLVLNGIKLELDLALCQVDHICIYQCEILAVHYNHWEYDFFCSERYKDWEYFVCAKYYPFRLSQDSRKKLSYDEIKKLTLCFL
ncbi:hypothetical protein DAMA08_013140 [Martiniozyma asiatica (nom. inval.)]|nr:hypothetical protein DAMA08_013140 [Martiniozyma asiatica]